VKNITPLGQYLEKSAGWMSHLGAGALGAGMGAGGMLAAQHYMNRTPPTPDDSMSTAMGGSSFGGEDALKSIFGGLFQGMGQVAAKEIIPRVIRGGGNMLMGDADQVFADVSKSDELLATADKKSLQNSFNTMQRFAPTLATDPNAVRAFLREAATTGSGVNYNTIKLLADAERAVNTTAGT